jgi:hypothetical protein
LKDRKYGSTDENGTGESRQFRLFAITVTGLFKTGARNYNQCCDHKGRPSNAIFDQEIEISTM